MTDVEINSEDSDGIWQIESKSLWQKVQDVIRSGIINGELPMGSKLVEQELAEKIGVSRAPVREALHRLEEEGLVDYLPRVGRFVHAVTEGEVRDVQEMRGVLEGWAARRFADGLDESRLGIVDELDFLVRRMEDHLNIGNLEEYYNISQEFHLRIVENAGSRILVNAHGNIMNLALFIRQLLGSVASRQHEATKEHRAILEAIRQADGEYAEKLMKEHYVKGATAIQKALASKATLQDLPK